MCYSKEVSLTMAGVIASGGGYSWWKYIRKGIPKRLRRFFMWTLIGYLCIGGHQLFEFLAIYTGNEVIYKIGLLISISCMFFLMKGFEVLTKFRFGSEVFALLIALLGVQMFMTEMTFENMHFWVRGNAHFLWAALWIFLFIYWNVCVLYVRKISTSKTNRSLLLTYGFYVINISFLVAVIYAYMSSVLQMGTWACPESALAAFKVIQDSPSVWCVFAAIQVFFIPVLFGKMALNYDLKGKFKVKTITLWKRLQLLLLAWAIWYALYVTLPLAFGVGWKMVTH